MKVWDNKALRLPLIKRNTARRIIKRTAVVIQDMTDDKIESAVLDIMPMIIMADTQQKACAPLSPSIMGGGIFIFLGTLLIRSSLIYLFLCGNAT